MAKKKASTKATKRAPGKKAKARARSSALLASISPSFTVNDLEKSLAWYRDVIGFAVEEEWKMDGKVAGISLQAGKIIFMIGQDDWKKGRDRTKGVGFRLYCTTTRDVDALARGIVARGGTIDSGPQDQPWGTRDFTVTDPDGFKITIGMDKPSR